MVLNHLQVILLVVRLIQVIISFVIFIVFQVFFLYLFCNNMMDKIILNCPLFSLCLYHHQFLLVSCPMYLHLPLHLLLHQLLLYYHQLSFSSLLIHSSFSFISICLSIIITIFFYLILCICPSISIISF